MKTRVLSLILASILLSSALAACSGDSGETKDTTAPADTTTAAETTTAETELTDGLEDKNMDGFELRFLHSTPASINWAEIRLDVAEEDTADILNEALYNRNAEICERFNAEITVTEEERTALNRTFPPMVTAGDCPYDIVMIYGVNAAGMIQYIADFNQIPYVKLDEAWWNPNASQIFHLGDKRFAAAGTFSLSYASTANGLAFNKRIYSSLNTGEDLYDLVREGKWTIDKFFNFSIAGTQDLNGDGVQDTNDQYGMAGTVKALHHMLVIGSGMRYVTMDEDNFPVFQMTQDEQLIGLFEKMIHFHITNPDCYSWPVDVSKGTEPVPFKDGKTLFNVSWPFNLTALRDMKDDFGVVPAPKYDEAQETYFANMANGEVATLPRSFAKDRLDNIGMLLEALSFYTHFEVIPVYKDVVLDLKVTRDMDSSEMLDIIFAGATYDYGINVWQNELGNLLMENLIFQKNDAIVSYLTSIKPTLDTKIADLKKAIDEMP